jgi:hypothetical protein
MNKNNPGADDDGLGLVASTNVNKTTTEDLDAGSSFDGSESASQVSLGHLEDGLLIGTDRYKTESTTRRSGMSQYEETHRQDNKVSHAHHKSQQQSWSSNADKRERAPSRHRQEYAYT